jgi:three-Cys-motif partner protein
VARRDDKYRLFSVEDLLTSQQIEAGKATASGKPVSRRPDLDSAEMYLSKEDHLLMRGVWPHSAKKSWMVSRIVDVVSKAMTGKWEQLGYAELYSGPGRLLDQSTGIELPGSPVEALRVRAPFDRYIFSDFDPDCVEALRARAEREKVGGRADVRPGDAKSIDHLKQVAREFVAGALVVVYLDPARPRDMAWTTVEHLARELPNVDLIINLPVNSLVRAISGPQGRDAAARAAGAFLGHPDPRRLMQWDCTQSHNVMGTIQAIRDFYDRQLKSLGFRPPGRRVVDYPLGVPYFDLLYASRHPLGVELWDRANPPDLPEPSLLDTQWTTGGCALHGGSSDAEVETPRRVLAMPDRSH